MRTLVAACLLLFCTVSALEAASIREARLRWLKGNYEEAREEYEEVLKDAKLFVPATIGISRALASQGEYDKALSTITDALKKKPKDADLLARQAELLHFRGRYREAVDSADAALAIDEKNLPAGWLR